MITIFVSTGKEQVPDVTVLNMKGVDVATAVKQLTDLGLTVDSEYTYVNSNTYTSRGVVVDQSPAGETSVSPGTEVKLTLSSGYRDLTIPLALPMEATTGVDIQVYVDGTLDQELSKTGLCPAMLRRLIWRSRMSRRRNIPLPYRFLQQGPTGMPALLPIG